MKALLLLDGYTLMKQLKFYFVFLTLYAGISLYSGQFMFLGFCVMFLTLMPYYLMQYTESTKSDALFLLMPCSRKTIVQERYVSVLLTLIPAALLALATLLVMGPDSALLILAECGLGLTLLSVALPIVYRYGVAKTRLILVCIMAALGGLGGGIGSRLGESAPGLFSETLPFWLPILTLVIALSALLISYHVSLRVYTKREF